MRYGDNVNFGDRLRELRHELGLTQAQLAERIGVSHVYISALERGAKPAPRLATVIALARCLGVPEDDLWALAQSEREARLRLRVQGDPTSLKTPKSNRKLNDPDTQSPEEMMLQKLKAITSNKKDRERVIQILDTMLEFLKQ